MVYENVPSIWLTLQVAFSFLVAPSAQHMQDALFILREGGMAERDVSSDNFGNGPSRAQGKDLPALPYVLSLCWGHMRGP